MIQPVLNSMWQAIVSNLPAVLLGAIYILLGWLTGRLLAALTGRILRRTRIDEAQEGRDLAFGLGSFGALQRPSGFIAGVIYWAVFLSFLLLALEVMRVQVLLQPVQALLAFLPRILAAGLITIAGVWLAQAVARTVQGALENLGMESPQAIGTILRTILTLLVLLLAIDQLGLDLSLLDRAIINLLTIAMGAVALAFALGSREITRDILSSYYVRERFRPGDRIRLQDREGTLEAIGPLHAEISTPDGRWLVPNKALIEGEVLLQERLEPE